MVVKNGTKVTGKKTGVKPGQQKAANKPTKKNTTNANNKNLPKIQVQVNLKALDSSAGKKKKTPAKKKAVKSKVILH